MLIPLPSFKNKAQFFGEKYAILANPEMYGKKVWDLSHFIVERAFSSTQIKPPFTYSESEFNNWLEVQQTEAWCDSRLPH